MCCILLLATGYNAPLGGALVNNIQPPYTRSWNQHPIAVQVPYARTDI